MERWDFFPCSRAMILPRTPSGHKMTAAILSLETEPLGSIFHAFQGAL